jgi:hypothetical protein
VIPSLVCGLFFLFPAISCGLGLYHVHAMTTMCKSRALQNSAGVPSCTRRRTRLGKVFEDRPARAKRTKSISRHLPRRDRYTVVQKDGSRVTSAPPVHHRKPKPHSTSPTPPAQWLPSVQERVSCRELTISINIGVVACNIAQE